MTHTRIFSASTFCLALAACSSGGLSHRVEADALEGVSPERQSQLVALEQSIEAARGEQTKAEKDLALATYELEKAESNRELLSNRVEHMDGLKDAADKLGDAKRVEDAQVVLTSLELMVEAHDEEIEWLEAEVDYYEIGIELAQAKVDVAEAQLMERRAEAIHKADLPSKTDYPLEDYKIQVSEKMAGTADLEAKSARAWKVIQEEKKEFQEALAQVPDDEAAEKKALAAEANKNREMADEMNALRKQMERLRKDNQRLQTTLATQDAGGGDAPALNPGGGAVKAGSGGDGDAESELKDED